MSRRPLTREDMGEFFVVHACLRRTAEVLVRALAEDAAAAAAPDEALVLSMAFAARLMDTHHLKEDELVWPALAERDDTFVQARDDLEAEHAALSSRLARVTAGLEAWRAAGGDLAGEHRVLIDDALKLQEELGAHLDHEETIAVPYMLRLFTPREWRRMQYNVLRSISLQDFAVLVPWIRATVDEELVQLFDAFLPWPARLANRLLWEERFQRLYGSVLVTLR